MSVKKNVIFYSYIVLVTTFNILGSLLLDLFLPSGINPAVVLFKIFFIAILSASFSLRGELSSKQREIVLLSICLLLIGAFFLVPVEVRSGDASSLLSLYRTGGPVVNLLFISVFAILKMFSERKKSSRFNPITGLGNENWMEDFVNGRIKAGAVRGTLGLMDVRNFRIINSIFGRIFGDELIKKVSEIILYKKDEGTVIAHLGGIEFCFWTETDETEIIRRIELAVPHIKQAVCGGSENFDLIIKNSIAVFPGDGANFNELLCKANIAMEAILLKPQRLIALYEPSMERDFKAENAYVYEINRALENNEFYICYQEKRSLGGAEVHGLEALARWDSKLLGTVSPAVFIPIIQKAGLAMRFTEMIIKKVFNDIPDIINSFGSGVSASINIPPSYFQNESFVNLVTDLVAVSDVEPRQITFEITENAFIEDLGLVNDIVRRLSGAGFRISLDDFGTGYSSLSYLHNLPVQELKIDKSFIDRIEESDRSFAFVKAICDIGKANDFTVVAEGVETENQLELLGRTSCDLIQGYIYSKPRRLPVKVAG